MPTKPPLTRILVSALVATSAAVALTSPAGASTTPQRTAVDAVAATNGAAVSISAVSSTDVWAAGYALTGDNAPSPLAEHWDGTGWHVTKTRLPADRPFGQLNAISALASDDVWAVGASEAVQFGTMQALAEHWNGKRWKIVPMPEPDGATWTELRSVVAVAPDDVWAVGYYFGGDGGSLIAHWDGTAWSLVDAADPVNAFTPSLQGVSAVSSTNVWATGFYFDEIGAGVTLVEHWNGKRWKLVDSPNVEGAPATELTSIAARSAKDVWATGFYTVTGSTFLSLTEHWDGTQWTIVDSPNPPDSQNSYLYGVDVLSTRDAWAVGYYLSGSNYHPFTEHWNGKKWKLVNTPDPGGSSYLYGIDALTTRDVWTAGFSFVGSGDAPYSEHWDGFEWTLIPLQ
jgi:hypothetical protein